MGTRLFWSSPSAPSPPLQGLRVINKTWPTQEYLDPRLLLQLTRFIRSSSLILLLFFWLCCCFSSCCFSTSSSWRQTIETNTVTRSTYNFSILTRITLHLFDDRTNYLIIWKHNKQNVFYAQTASALLSTQQHDYQIAVKHCRDSFIHSASSPLAKAATLPWSRCKILSENRRWSRLKTRLC